MKIIISPAKALNFEIAAPIKEYSQPKFLKQAETLNKVLSKKSVLGLRKLMNISKKLAELNWERNQKWEVPFSFKNSKQAIFAFKGDVFLGINIDTLESEKIALLQQRIRILSGLYGILKPLDLIQPYRLEMGVSLKVGSKKNLYQFWGASLTDFLNQELDKDELVINLASKEYFQAIEQKKLKTTIIEPVFKDYKNGEFKSIYLFMKRARGMMARFVIDKNIKDLEGLKTFNYGGYYFSKEFSANNQLVFIRKNV